MGANTSFFDEPVDDESISLNDAELSNILEDANNDQPEEKGLSGSSEFVTDEPEVEVIDRKDIIARIPALEKGAQIDLEPVGASETAEAETVDLPEVVDEVQAEPVDVATTEEISLDDSGLKDLGSEETLLSPEVESSEEITLEEAGLDAVESVSEIPSLQESEDVALSSEELDNITSMGGILDADSVQADEPDLTTTEEVMDISAEGIPELSSSEVPGIFNEPEKTVESIQPVEQPTESETIDLDDLPSFDSSQDEIVIAGLDDIPLQKKVLNQSEVSEMPSLSTVEEVTFDDHQSPAQDDLPEMKSMPIEEMTVIDNDELITNEPMQSIDLEESGATEDLKSDMPAEEFNVDEMNLSTGENLEQKPDHPILSNSYFGETDEDESITLSSDELNNIISTSDVEDSSTASTPASQDRIQAGDEKAVSMDNLRELFVYLDNLLDKLPENEVKRFSESRYYDLYNKIFEELDLV